MAENARRNVPPPDPEAATGCRSELTRTSSDSSSLTVESARDSSHVATQDQTTTWTDEKHYSYLNFLEAKFVEELNDSMSTRSQKNGWGPYSTCSPSDQFVVVQGGCRKKIKFDGISPLVGKTTSTHVRLESPWVHHFKATGKSHSLTFDAQRNGVPSSERVRLERDLVFSTESASSGHNFMSNPCHYDSIGSNKEVSDQNFSEEDCGQSSIYAPTAKRKASVDALSKDQVVPSENFIVPDISDSSNASL